MGSVTPGFLIFSCGCDLVAGLKLFVNKLQLSLVLIFDLRCRRLQCVAPIFRCSCSFSLSLSLAGARFLALLVPFDFFLFDFLSYFSSQFQCRWAAFFYLCIQRVERKDPLSSALLFLCVLLFRPVPPVSAFRLSVRLRTAAQLFVE